MNCLMLIGNLTKDPEITKAGEYTKCTFNLAVQRRRAGRDGVKLADFIPITAWRRLADTCGKYLHKGSRVAVLAHVSVDRYEDQEGHSRLSFQFIADSVEFQPGGKKSDEASAAGAHDPETTGGFVPVDDDEMPF